MLMADVIIYRLFDRKYQARHPTGRQLASGVSGYSVNMDSRFASADGNPRFS